MRLGLICVICLLMSTKAFAACDHEYKGQVEAKPNCTDEGIMYYQCTKCGDEYEEQLNKRQQKRRFNYI